MDSLTLKFACGFVGRATGVSGSPTLSAQLADVARCSVDGADQQVYKKTLTIAGAATTTLDLTSGLTSILNEAIVFAHVKGVLIEHDPASVSTTGITAFGGASNDFQGVWSASDKATLVPGRWIAFGMPATDTGVVVDGTHKNIAIVNLHATLAATVNVFVLGTTT